MLFSRLGLLVEAVMEASRSKYFGTHLDIEPSAQHPLVDLGSGCWSIEFVL